MGRSGESYKPAPHLMESALPREPSKVNELRRRIDECATQLKAAAHQEAYRFRLPWELSRLREAGELGVLEALKAQKERALGLPFPQAAYGEIEKTTRAAAERLRARREGGEEAPPPTEENILEALETFSKQEWRDLIAGFEEQDLTLLRSYLDAHTEEVGNQLGRTEYLAVFGSAVSHSIFLRARLLSRLGARMTPVTHPMWAAAWAQNSRQRKMEGAPRPSRRRSWEEMASYRGIAEALSRNGQEVTDKLIKVYFERMKQVPIEKFDGDVLAYYSMIADTRAFQRYLRSQYQGASPEE